MKQRKRTRKAQYRIDLLKRALLWALLVVFVAIVLSSIINLIKHPTNTVIVKKGSISREETNAGVIIR